MILASIFKFFIRIFCHFRFLSYLCTRLEAQMAESVDALVSNTSGATRAGSTPALGTRLQGKKGAARFIFAALFVYGCNYFQKEERKHSLDSPFLTCVKGTLIHA